MKRGYVLAAAMMLTSATATQAQSAGDFILSVGWNHFRTQSGHQVIGTTTFDYDPYDYDDHFELEDADSVGLTGTYFFTDHLAGELTLSTPARYSLPGLDEKEDAVNLSILRQRNASFLLKYYFFDADEKFRPYIGVGISRVWFENQTTQGDFYTVPLTYHSSFRNQWAPVFNGGLSYQFNKHWVGGLSVSYMPLRTTASTHSIIDMPSVPDFDPYPVTNKTQLKLNPVVTYLSLGYRF